jgi:hypothetical protein
MRTVTSGRPHSNLALRIPFTGSQLGGREYPPGFREHPAHGNMPPRTYACATHERDTVVFDTSTPASHPPTNTLRLALHWANAMLNVLATVIALGAGPTCIADYTTIITNMRARARRRSASTTSRPSKAVPPTARTGLPQVYRSATGLPDATKRTFLDHRPRHKMAPAQSSCRYRHQCPSITVATPSIAACFAPFSLAHGSASPLPLRAPGASHLHRHAHHRFVADACLPAVNHSLFGRCGRHYAHPHTAFTLAAVACPAQGFVLHQPTLVSRVALAVACAWDQLGVQLLLLHHLTPRTMDPRTYANPS